jgi:hypothetical protein
MLRKIFIFLLVVVISLLATSCSSSGASKSGSRSTSYEKTLGTTTAVEFKRNVPLIFSRYQFETYRAEESADQIYFESRWKERYPFQDELTAGAIKARTRIFVTSRPRYRDKSGYGKVQKVFFTAENQVVLQGTEVWQEFPLTDMFLDYIKRIAGDLELEMKSGIQEF